MRATIAVVMCFVLSILVVGKSDAADQVASATIKMKVTAYCPCTKCCGKDACGLTSTGKDAKTPGVAAAPKLLPYGTKLEIPGVGTRVVDDTGGAMRKDAKKGIYHIDVRYQTHEEALEFGVQWLAVKVN